MADNNPKIHVPVGPDVAACSADLSQLATERPGNTGEVNLIQANCGDPQVETLNNPNLAQASINASDTMRVAPSVRARIIRSGLVKTATSVDLSNSRSRAKPTKSSDGSPYGIFSNPFYRYDGGLANKILAFIGNILKVIERLFLRLLGARDPGPINERSRSKTPANEDTLTRGESLLEKEERERLARKDRRERQRGTGLGV